MGRCIWDLIITVIGISIPSLSTQPNPLMQIKRLRFRISEIGLAGKASGGRWEKERFGGTQDFLPGIPSTKLMEEVTYPRFVNVEDDLILTWRIGQYVPSPL